MTDIKVPNVGESVSEVTVATWFKKVGEAVKKDEALVELETDKAAQELVAPEDGVLEEIVVAEGENAEVGALIARLGSGESKPAAKKESKSAKKAAPKKEAPAAKSAESGVELEIHVPNVGESVAEVTVASWMKGVGDTVAKDEPVVELETDKAAQELVAPASGTITEIVVPEGEVAAVGALLAKMSTGAAPTTSAEAAPSPSASAPAASGKDPMPSAQRMIKEKGLDAGSIAGTGKDGRITKGDALAAKATPAPVAATPAVTSSAPRDIGPREERVRLSR
ncbi:MAG: dihydrolipoamide succinyltransferase, partial [Acidimicrobiales bacterium]